MVRVRGLAIALAVSGVAASTLFLGTAVASKSPDPAVNAAADLPIRQVVPALLPNAKENTSVIAQNNGTTPATIQMDIYTAQGLPVSGATRTETNVPPGGTRTFEQAVNNGLTPGFRGVGVLSSNNAINAILVRDMLENGTFRHAYSLHNAYSSGANVLTLPFVANNLANIYQTRFAIANTGNAIACVTVQYAYVGGGGMTDNGPGGGGCATGYAVPVGGQIAFGPNAVPAEGTLAMPGATAGKLMSATVTSTGATVTVAADAYRLNIGTFQLASYDGFVVGDPSSTTDDIGTTIAVPVALKIDGFYTQILMSNPGGTDAHVTITYKANSGETYTANRTVPANGTANHSTYDVDGGIPEGFQGAATITSDQPIAAVVFRAKMTFPGSQIDEDLYTAVNGVPTDRATTVAKEPLIFRRAYGNNSTCESSGLNCGYNSWVAVIVPGGGNANLTLTTIADTTTSAPGCGTAATYTTNYTVTNGSYIFYQNANQSGSINNGLGQNPNCLWGGMTITSDVPILVVTAVTSDLTVGDNDGLYNGFTS